MKLVVIGGTGRIGSQVVHKLTAAGHEAVPAAPSTCVDLITGAGLDRALEGAGVVCNVANSPTFSDAKAYFSSAVARGSSPCELCARVWEPAREARAIAWLKVLGCGLAEGGAVRAA